MEFWTLGNVNEYTIVYDYDTWGGVKRGIRAKVYWSWGKGCKQMILCCTRNTAKETYKRANSVVREHSHFGRIKTN